MAILSHLTDEIKAAMRAKDTLKLEALRAIKSAMMLVQTSAGGSNELSEEEEIKLVQKLVKQRKDSAQIFREQNRADLAEPEEAQAEIIAAFLPEQLTEEEIGAIVAQVIEELNATSMQDMGKVMGKASQVMAGKADGKTISSIVRNQLNA